MTFKNLIITFSVAVSLFLSSGCFQRQKSKTTERPNIVWIVTEDMNPILDCYGDKLAKTPNIDKLAETGVVYQQAYANAPICAPARSCLITGVYPTSMGTPHLRQEQTIPDWLKPFPKSSPKTAILLRTKIKPISISVLKVFSTTTRKICTRGGNVLKDNHFSTFSTLATRTRDLPIQLKTTSG